MGPLKAAHRTGQGALLVDLDGTLVDSSGAHRLAFERALLEHDLNVEFEYRQIAGMSSPTAARALGVPEAKISEFVETKRSRYLEAVDANEIDEIVGAHKMVGTATACGWRLALVTSASRGSVQGLSAQFGWLATFEVVVCGDDVASGKPAPECFQAAVARLNVPKEACVGIEDSEAGLAALLAANVAAIRVSGDPAGAGADLERIALELRDLGAIGG